LPGDYLRGRLSLAIYCHMEMLDCIATDPSDFARIALRLGTDLEFRQTIEKQIETGSKKIFNDPIFLRDTQDFLLTVEPRPA
jgi:predicted O-linked N-acetylglucosamine transferase (SPINDLY family)